MRHKLRTENQAVDDKYAAAIHKAGQLIAAEAAVLDIRGRGVCSSPHGHNPTKEELHEASIVVALAGTVAEYNLLVLHDAILQRGKLQINERDVACSLLELLPIKRQFLRNLMTTVLSVGDYWKDFWNLLFTLTTSTQTDRETALEEVNDYTDADENADLMEVNASLFELLWPLAQKAHDIIDYHWSSVEKLASELLKTGSVGEQGAEARPFHVR